MTVEFFIALLGFLTVALSCFNLYAGNRRERHMFDQDEHIQEIHVLVNSRMTDALKKIAVLQAALEAVQAASSQALVQEVVQDLDGLQDTASALQQLEKYTLPPDVSPT